MEFYFPPRQQGDHNGDVRGYGTLCGLAVVLFQQRMLAQYLEGNDLLQMHNGTRTPPTHLQVYDVYRINTTSSNNYGFCTNARGNRKPRAGKIPEVGKTEEETEG